METFNMPLCHTSRISGTSVKHHSHSTYCGIEDVFAKQHSPSDGVAKVVVDQENRSKGTDGPEVGAIDGESDDCIHDHENSAGYFYNCPRVGDEGLEAHPPDFHPALDADDQETGELDGEVQLLAHDTARLEGRRLEESEGEQREGGHEVQGVEEAVVHVLVRGERLVTPRVVQQFLVVLPLFQVNGSFVVVELPDLLGLDGRYLGVRLLGKGRVGLAHHAVRVGPDVVHVVESVRVVVGRVASARGGERRKGRRRGRG